MRILLILLIGLMTINNSYSQDKMIIDQSFNGNTSYGGFAEPIDSLTDLPTAIQLNVNGYLNRFLGTMSDSVTFSHGQMVDLEKKFKKDSVTYRYDWIVPKYDLNFVLSDRSIGIRSYYLQIRLDQYGQIVSSNWPQKFHSDKKHLSRRSEIERFALRQARIKGFDTSNYLVDLKYNEKFDQLCWLFKFPSRDEDEHNRKEYYIFEVSWNFIRIVDEYIQTTVSYH